jgi:hypothetical protein
MSRKVIEKEQTLAFSIDNDPFKALAKYTLRPSGDYVELYSEP